MWILAYESAGESVAFVNRRGELIWSRRRAKRYRRWIDAVAAAGRLDLGVKIVRR